jgi:hypothetical protein
MALLAWPGWKGSRNMGFTFDLSGDDEAGQAAYSDPDNDVLFAIGSMQSKPCIRSYHRTMENGALADSAREQ